MTEPADVPEPEVGPDGTHFDPPEFRDLGTGHLATDGTLVLD